MDFAAEDVTRHRAADQRGRDVVEEAREDEHDREQHEPALPAIRQECRHLVGDAALLEMAREDREAHQQQEQIGQDHGLVLHVQGETGEPRAGLEAGERQLVDDDRRKPGQRNLQGLVMEDRDPDQRQAEQDEVDRNSQHEHRLSGRGSGRCRGGGRADRNQRGEGCGDCNDASPSL